MTVNIRAHSSVFSLLIAVSLTACGDKSSETPPTTKSAAGAANTGSAGKTGDASKPAVSTGSKSDAKKGTANALGIVGSFMLCEPNSSSHPDGKWYGYFEEYDGNNFSFFDGTYSDAECKTPIPANSKDFFILKTLHYVSRPSKVDGVYEIDVENAAFWLQGMVDNYLESGDTEDGKYDGSTPEK